MRYLLLLQIFICQSIFACDVPLGRYEAIIESEYAVAIKFMENGVFQIEHENWWPGQRGKMGELHIYTGTWSCDSSDISVSITAETISAKMEAKQTETPYGIKGSENVISFSSTTEKNSMLSAFEFWPKSFIVENFETFYNKAKQQGPAAGTH